ncbi:MBL fold metallo-hydrolase [Dermatobacter hominis]|uniref:MBL fold metallo-hydrolase n=1 Tax=Dermatobacter hominis TaxID=2884263 RepID=UPI001D12A2B3|nr:MBL fold metallo-hydrolase [Dermatobacter hominis]UDY37899.1 MBL fold metallo-hydrolase [Dermatobacter hominis]
MQTTVNEIAPDVFRLSTSVAEVGPTGFTFNQFVIRDDEPFLFHTGMRGLFPLVADAVARVVPLSSLRWISFGHVEADESGAVNEFLAAAPEARVVHGALACDISLNDLCDRPPRSIDPGEVLDLGHHRLRFLPTPHVPHNWESGLWFDESTRTLFAGDLLSQAGAERAPVVEADLVEDALLTEEVFHSTSRGPDLVPTLERLATLEPTTLAVMHGSSFRGDGATQLRALASGYAAALADAA